MGTGSRFVFQSIAPSVIDTMLLTGQPSSARRSQLSPLIAPVYLHCLGCGSLHLISRPQVPALYTVPLSRGEWITNMCCEVSWC